MTSQQALEILVRSEPYHSMRLWPSTKENSQTTCSVPGASVKDRAEMRKVHLGLPARRGLEANLKAARLTWAQWAHQLLHRRVAAAVAQGTHRHHDQR